MPGIGADDKSLQIAMVADNVLSVAVSVVKCPCSCWSPSGVVEEAPAETGISDGDSGMGCWMGSGEAGKGGGAPATYGNGSL
jgi:hypothetical protein